MMRIPVPGADAFSRTHLLRGERWVLGVLIILLVASTAALLWRVNEAYRVTVPASGGELTEGVIGSPRFINPLLARSDTDRALTNLIYAGLMRVNKSGELVPELAESYTIGDEGSTYTFTLRDDITWHDGEPVTARDVVFTIKRIQDPNLRSPQQANWEGITVEMVDPRTVRFTLEEPYAPFLENTTIGIIPEHIWKNVNVEQYTFSTFNVRPIGAGPYKIEHIQRTSRDSVQGGIPEAYVLTPFRDYAEGKPYLSTIRFQFYSSEEALVDAYRSDAVESMHSISPRIAADLADEGRRVLRSPLPRTFGIFFNQDEKEIFTEEPLRIALDEALNKERIIDEVLHGYGTRLEGPLPPGTLGYSAATTTPSVSASERTGTTSPRIRRARERLVEAGWTYNEQEEVLEKDGAPLQFSLATSAIPELKRLARMLKQRWERLGAEVKVEVFESGNLNREVIRPRDYEALLFGEILGRNSDPYAFWHSSQRRDPGLNIALYANIAADGLLEEARATPDKEERAEIYREFTTEVKQDHPAIFLYAPDFIYVLPEEVHGVHIEPLTTSAERFLNVHEWYINTDHVWPMFTDTDPSPHHP